MELSERLEAAAQCAVACSARNSIHEKLFREFLRDAEQIGLFKNGLDPSDAIEYLNGEFNGNWTELLELFQKLAPFHYFAAATVANWE